MKQIFLGDYKGIKFQEQVNIVITQEVNDLLYNYRQLRMKLFDEGQNLKLKHIKMFKVAKW